MVYSKSSAIFLALNLVFFSAVSATNTCPKDTLKIGACLTALNLVNLIIGTPPVKPCCSLLGDLVGLEAALCLCTIVKADILGIKLRVPIDISLLINNCGVPGVPTGFACPAS